MVIIVENSELEGRIVDGSVKVLDDVISEGDTVELTNVDTGVDSVVDDVSTVAVVITVEYSEDVEEDGIIVDGSERELEEISVVEETSVVGVVTVDVVE